MDLKELDYIVTVADEGSISRAAEKLFMAQSSLSQAVRLIEQDLGTSVFVRTARGVRLTGCRGRRLFLMPDRSCSSTGKRAVRLLISKT